MKLTAITNFSWTHRGVELEHFEAGQVIETEDQDLIDVSATEGWAEAESDESAEAQKAAKPAQNKAHKAAPENKSA